jgi:hypothetical protein
MPGLPPRHEALRALAQDSGAQATVKAQAGPVPADVSSWLSDLGLLIGLPFVYLVPDARMLPPESVRFFVIDQNWIAALVDGALALAGTSAPAASAVAMFRPDILAAAQDTSVGRRRAAAVPGQAAGTATGTAATVTGTGTVTGTAGTATVYSGMLLRSSAVADWPGLRVSGFADQAATTPLAVARFERLAPTILLVLFAGLAQRVDVSEPAQHLHFGVGSAATPAVPLRWIDQGRAGNQVQLTGNPDPSCPVQLRSDPSRAVVNVRATVAAVGQALTAAYSPQPLPHFGSAALALQMLQGSQSQSFTTGAAS